MTNFVTMGDFDPLVYDEVFGLYARNDRAAPPPGFLSAADNLVFSPAFLRNPTNYGTMRFRESFVEQQVLPCIPIRFYIYTKSTGNRLILLDASGQIWDSVSGTIIATIVDAIDFHGITMNDHFYFTPHNRVTGLDGQFVYVYDPILSATARKAAGAPMTGIFTVAVSGVNGTIEPGEHVVAISYVSNTGFRSKPALHQRFTAPTSPRKKLSLTAIPLGPSDTVERIIWMSPLLINFTGDLANVRLYLAYRIMNNTTTALADTVDAFDTQLITGADPYIDLMAEIPAGTFLTNLDGRLVVCGTKLSPHTLYVSNSNEPENIDSIDGLREIAKGDGGGVNTTRPHRGNIICWKSERTIVVYVDKDALPAEWPVDVIDGALGAEVYGVSETLNSQGMFFDVYLVANQLGLNLFNGTYQNILKPLSYNISQKWRAAFSLDQKGKNRVIVDPINFRVYVLLFGELGVEWYFADFANGLSFDNVKWSNWKFDYPDLLHKDYIDLHAVTDPAIDDNNVVLLAICNGETTLRQLITNSVGTGADVDGDLTCSLGIKLASRTLDFVHVEAVKMHVGASIGNNSGQYEVVGPEEAVNSIIESFSPSFVNSIVRRNVTKTDEFVEFKIRAIGGDINISKFIVYAKEVYADKNKY